MRKDIGVMKKLIAKKGFTLAECVIAIAVFAILTTMILFIVGNAVKTNKSAMDQEKNLNGLIANVVQDQSPKRYGDHDSDILKMDFERASDSSAKADFTMTYSTVDGYKNYVQCPVCAVNGNGGLYTNQEFMSDAAYSSANYLSDYAADNSINTRYKPSHWFLPESMSYKCPACGTILNNATNHIPDPSNLSENAKINGTDEDVVYSVKLRCLSCENEGFYNDCKTDAGDTSKAFKFDSDTGNYICQQCQSGNVVQILGGVPITKNATSDSGLQISGMSANTIRYSNLEEPTDEKKVSHVTLDGVGITEEERSYTVTLKADSSNPTAPTKYTLSVTGLNLDPSREAEMNIELPGSYVLNITYLSDVINGKNTGDAVTSVTPPSDYRNGNSKNKITISGITRNQTGSAFDIEFTLKNYINDNSFDYDYKEEGGLHKFWFGVDAGIETKTIGSTQLTFDKSVAIVIDPSKRTSTTE